VQHRGVLPILREDNQCHGLRRPGVQGPHPGHQVALFLSRFVGPYAQEECRSQGHSSGILQGVAAQVQ